MPNTLAHLGAQALATRTLIPGADLKWIFAGAVVPDVPWILGRATRTLLPGLHDYDLWAYLIAQSSLAVSLLLCGALAALALRPLHVFGVLSLNALLHLLLDGLQEKWGNRVHLLAPFTWDGWSAGWFRIESWPTYVLTALGTTVALWALVRVGRTGTLHRVVPRRIVLATLLLTTYLTTPILLRDGPIAADSNYIRTLREREHRAGRTVVFDRAPYRATGDRHHVRTYIGEELPLSTRPLPRATTVSIRAHFLDDSTLVVDGLRAHSGWNRDPFNYAGLIAVAAVWGLGLLREARSGRRRHQAT